jgi:hypothetical protein
MDIGKYRVTNYLSFSCNEYSVVAEPLIVYAKNPIVAVDIGSEIFDSDGLIATPERIMHL